MDTDRFLKLHKAIGQLPVEFALRWCEPGLLGCACMGCANRSGGLAAQGFTRTEWRTWWSAQASTPGVIVVDLQADAFKKMTEAAQRSTWMPPEYMANDWIADVCSFLEFGPDQSKWP